MYVHPCKGLAMILLAFLLFTSPATAVTLSGAMLFSSNSRGGIGGGVESNTLGEQIAPGVPWGPSNLYLSTTSDASSGFLNSGNGPSTSINITLVPGTRTFYIFAVATSDLTGYAGLNLFFNGNNFSPSSPGITGVNQTNNAGTGVSAASDLNTLDLGGGNATSPRTLVFLDGLTTVTLTSFEWITNSSAVDLVSQWNNTPDGWRDHFGRFTLHVSGPDKVGVYRTGTWYLDTNRNGQWDGCGTDGCIGWGGDPVDQVVLGDWNGSGTTKIGVYRNGTWYLDYNGNGTWDGCGTDACISWGGDESDVAVVGDWNGSGTTKIGVYRNGVWYLDYNGNGAWDSCTTDKCLSWGGDPTDRVVLGDWNGAGSTKIGVYRASTGTWYLDTNGNGTWDGCGTDACIAWGGDPADVPIIGDWNGSGLTKIGVYRNGTWYLDKNGNGLWDGCGTDACISWGGDPTDVPKVGDWNGAGSTKIGVYRGSSGTWYLDTNGNGTWDGCGTDACISWGGNAGDQPLLGKW